MASKRFVSVILPIMSLSGIHTSIVYMLEVFIFQLLNVILRSFSQSLVRLRVLILLRKKGLVMLKDLVLLHLKNKKLLI